MKDTSAYWQMIFLCSLVDNTQNEYYHLYFTDEKIKAKTD